MTNEIEHNALDTEHQILAAAEREFLSKGFAGARTTAIAEAAGVTHGMLHYYFRTKEKLFEKILSDKINLMKGLIVASVDNQELTLHDRLRRIINVHLDFLAANPELPKFLLNEVFGNPERHELMSTQIRAIAPMVIGLFEADFQKAVAAGECRPVDMRMIIIDIMSLNAFSFVARPMLDACFGELTADSDKFLELRKAEIFDTIWRKISNQI